MHQSDPAGRLPHREGALLRKYGKSSLRELRQLYGASFAQGVQATATLADVIYTLDAFSLAQLLRHHAQGSSDYRSDAAEVA